jgi:hypothetical protein
MNWTRRRSLRRAEPTPPTHGNGGGRIELSAGATGTSDTQTQASWRVAELAELRARGVEIIEYDTGELRTENGILDTGDASHAWIVDPGGNALGIQQHK